MQPEKNNENGKEWKLLALVIILGLGLRLSGSALFPVWSGPEEGAHFFVIQYIGENRQLPMIPLTKETVKSIYVQSIHQPPLYYTAMAPFYMLVANQSDEFIVHFLRLFSVALGTACIALTYLIAKRLSFGKTVRIGSAMFVALLPTHVIASSTLGNDALTWVFCTAAIYFCIAAIQNKKAFDIAAAGLLVAAAILTKFNALSIMAIFVPAAIIFLLKGKGNAIKRLAICAIPLLAAPMALRNIALTSKIMPSFLKEPRQLSLEWITYYVSHLFPSFWLQEYGVATIPDIRYLFFAFYGAVSFAAIIGFAKLMTGSSWIRERKFMIAILLLGVLLNLAGLTYVNVFGWWPEGRWLFPTLSIIAILFIAGLQKFMKMVGQENKANVFIWFMLFTMLALNIIVLVFHNTVVPLVPWAVPA